MLPPKDQGRRQRAAQFGVPRKRTANYCCRGCPWDLRRTRALPSINTAVADMPPTSVSLLLASNRLVAERTRRYQSVTSVPRSRPSSSLSSSPSPAIASKLTLSHVHQARVCALRPAQLVWCAVVHLAHGRVLRVVVRLRINVVGCVV